MGRVSGMGKPSNGGKLTFPESILTMADPPDLGETISGGRGRRRILNLECRMKKCGMAERQGDLLTTTERVSGCVGREAGGGRTRGLALERRERAMREGAHVWASRIANGALQERAPKG